MGWAGDWDVGPIQGPDTLGDPRSWNPIAIARGSCTWSMVWHILEGTAKLQDGLPSSDLAHPKEMVHIVEAGGREQLEQGKGQLGICEEGDRNGGILLLQMWPELLQKVLEGGLGHPEHLQPLLIIPSVLDNVQLAILTGTAGPEVAGLEA
ncbi:hypothetical protein Y1Q_0010386 [Alligator mississippiensis]|uniref:Uncharacterized protein n=1 Tax=Alligator mississippiensis TaxID=8496 RepID=A0A151MPL4_ALLMI|nr:hypothetical protein Y1Q_0010386 [Alligator mississippiensis]